MEYISNVFGYFGSNTNNTEAVKAEPVVQAEPAEQTKPAEPAEQTKPAEQAEPTDKLFVIPDSDKTTKFSEEAVFRTGFSVAYEELRKMSEQSLAKVKKIRAEQLEKSAEDNENDEDDDDEDEDEDEEDSDDEDENIDTDDVETDYIESCEKVADIMCGGPISNVERLTYVTMRMLIAGYNSPMTAVEYGQKIEDAANQTNKDIEEENAKTAKIFESHKKRMARIDEYYGRKKIDRSDPKTAELIAQIKKETDARKANMARFKAQVVEAYTIMKSDSTENIESRLTELASKINADDRYDVTSLDVFHVVNDVIDGDL
jgi:hypothetical protein